MRCTGSCRGLELFALALVFLIPIGSLCRLGLVVSSVRLARVGSLAGGGLVQLAYQYAVGEWRTSDRRSVSAAVNLACLPAGWEVRLAMACPGAPPSVCIIRCSLRDVVEHVSRVQRFAGCLGCAS